MSNLAIILVVAVLIPALLVVGITIRDFMINDHPHRRVSDQH